MILDLEDLNEHLKAFMAGQRPLGSPDTFDWLLFEAEGVIALHREIPSRYLVLNGAIQVREAGTDGKSVVAGETLSDGDVLDAETDDESATSIYLTAQPDVSLMPLLAMGDIVWQTGHASHAE